MDCGLTILGARHGSPDADDAAAESGRLRLLSMPDLGGVQPRPDQGT